MIDQGQSWIDMLQDRNKTTHIYDEKQALDIYKKIKDTYFGLLNVFAEYVQRKMPEL